MTKPKALLLKAVPDDVRKTLLIEQADHQIKCGCTFSKEKTMYLIARKWAKIKNYRINNVPVSKMVDDL